MEHKPLHQEKLKLKDLSFSPLEEFKRVSCPSCNSIVKADNLNINDKVAKCNNCDVVFSFENVINNLAKPKKVKQEILKPEGIDLFQYGDDLDISVQQQESAFDIILILLMLVPLPFIVFYAEGKTSLINLIMSILVGIIPFVNLFLLKRHRVFVNIDRNHLVIEHKPKKFHKNLKVNVSDIDQLYVKNYSGYYNVYMITNGVEGQKHQRIIWTKSLSKARYLEQEIERHIGIKDRQVPEETA